MNKKREDKEYRKNGMIINIDQFSQIIPLFAVQIIFWSMTSDKNETRY